jgi:hypothetical protein
MHTNNRKLKLVLGGLITTTMVVSSFISTPTANAAKAKSKKATKTKKSVATYGDLAAL